MEQASGPDQELKGSSSTDTLPMATVPTQAQYPPPPPHHHTTPPQPSMMHHQPPQSMMGRVGHPHQQVSPHSQHGTPPAMYYHEQSHQRGHYMHQPQHQTPQHRMSPGYDVYGLQHTPPPPQPHPMYMMQHHVCSTCVYPAYPLVYLL